jgi:hypothetical protein
MASATSGGLPRSSAVARNSLRRYETVFSPAGCGGPLGPISTGAAAPIVALEAIVIRRAERAISAPAEIARPFTKAMVSSGVPRSASRITTAASTRPPKVSISSTSAAAPACSASPITRLT